ncbi:hypothetical protein DFQ14_108136 [Halopolyspora algeriensis]|uniref:Uncharacterized protein n=1 Tax=Halopolyspora algeriensis TaxID=1500506 RepID=A0A368VSD2_9ACTN|nr:hypothetical protein [Halopolyspora algeriensis]RCW42876.1 hypothetical protein DFQ14_108136 [Halopolyspora algeriensis]TQM56655.1 hypothetical protein FHU43_1463 [Halopolyspora algeriensis]
MDRKGVLVVVSLAVIAAGFLVTRDPVGAAETVRRGWDLAVSALAMVADSLVTFLRHLFEGQ